MVAVGKVVFTSRENITRDQGATLWVVELGSPKVLEKRYEWTPNVMKVGDNITVDGWLAKDGRRFVSAKSVTLSNGKQLFGASSFYDLPGRCVSDEVLRKKCALILSVHYCPALIGHPRAPSANIACRQLMQINDCLKA
jgi:hypothetical protein